MMPESSPKTAQKQPFFRCKNSATDFGGVKSPEAPAPHKFQSLKNVSTFSPKDYIKEGRNGYKFSTRQCWLNRATKRRVSMSVTTGLGFSGSTAIQAIQTPKGSIVATTLPHDQRECCTAFNTVNKAHSLAAGFPEQRVGNLCHMANGLAEWGLGQRPIKHPAEQHCFAWGSVPQNRQNWFVWLLYTPG